MKDWNPVEEGEIYTLLNHYIERLPKLKEGIVQDFLDGSTTKLSFESPNFIITMKLEKKKEVEIAAIGKSKTKSFL